MEELSQAQLFRLRAEQHESCARIVTAPDIVRFHTDLAAHYRRLAGEVGELMPQPLPPAQQ